MDSDPPLPRKALFKTRQSGILNSKYSQTRSDSNGFEKGEFMTGKASLQFEHDVEWNLKAFEKELHVQRLENLRHLAEKLKDDAWMYPELENTLGI